MTTIKPLTAFRVEDLEFIMPGYTSTAQYAVTRQVSRDTISFELRLVTLAEPFTKQWDFRDPLILDHYRACVEAGLALGAFAGPQIVGIAICEAQRWNGALLILEFGVAPTHRRQGIGQDLMQAVIDLARQQQLRVVVAETQNTNMPAIRFYRGLGFELDGLDMSYYTNDDFDQGEIALFMKRKI